MRASSASEQSTREPHTNLQAVHQAQFKPARSHRTQQKTVPDRVPQMLCRAHDSISQV